MPAKPHIKLLKHVVKAQEVQFKPGVYMFLVPGGGTPGGGTPPGAGTANYLCTLIISTQLLLSQTCCHHTLHCTGYMFSTCNLLLNQEVVVYYTNISTRV